MKYLLAALFVISSLSSAQQRIVLDADIGRPASTVHLVSGAVNAIMGGVIDGSPPPTEPLKLRVVKLRSLEQLQKGARTVRFEMRLTNASSTPIKIPIGDDFDAVATKCGNAAVHETDLGIWLGVAGGPMESLHTRNTQWYGCDAITGSVINLLPGEWVTYRGTAQLPDNTQFPATLRGNWSLAELRFAARTGGLAENVTTHLVITSNEQVLK